MRLIAFLACVCFVSLLRAEDGSRLWLRMERNADAAEVRVERGTKRTATVDIAVRELEDYWKGGGKVVLRVAEDGSARDGFSIGRTEKEEMVLTSASGQGLLYAAYGLLRMQQVGDTLGVGQTVSDAPAYDLRILNHWDNPDGTIERGYAGRSIWRWDELPGTVSPRYEAYARANASVGINGAVLNNVNAKPLALSSDMLRKTAAIVENLDYAAMAESLDIGTIINKKAIAAGHIYQMMLDVDVSNLKCLTVSAADVVEFVAAEKSKATRKLIKDLDLPKGATIGGLVRNGEGILVSGDTQIQSGDSVVVFCVEMDIRKLEHYFN